MGVWPAIRVAGLRGGVFIIYGGISIIFGGIFIIFGGILIIIGGIFIIFGGIIITIAEWDIQGGWHWSGWSSWHRGWNSKKDIS